MRKFLYCSVGTLLAFSQAQAVEVSTAEDFRNALQAGEDITLTGDITLSEQYGQTATPRGENQVIDGGGFTVSGGTYESNMVRNFGNIDSISNITFSGFYNDPNDSPGSDDELGGAITNMGTIGSITNTTFTNNSAFDGGAIFNGAGATINYIDATFTGNKSIAQSAAGEASGAAIFNQGLIKDLRGYFSENNAWLHAAVWNYGTIENITATFEHNYRSALGGNGGSVTVTSSVFRNNTTWEGREGAGQSGAAIIYYGGTWKVIDSDFEQNTVWWKGGAIAQTGGLAHMTITGSRFTGNTAAEEGGAIYFGGSATSTGTISDSYFEANSSSWGGGAVNNGASQVIINEGTRIVNNTAPAGGGGIHNSGDMQISDSFVIGNHTTTGWTGAGGGIYNTISASGAGKIEINNTEISGNYVATSGGGIYNAGDMTISNSVLSDNYMTLDYGNGGAIYNTTVTINAGTDNEKVSDGRLEISNTTISGNRAGNGAGIYVAGGDVSVTGSEISSNTASRIGGAVYAADGSVTLTNVDIHDNAGASGGAVHSLTDITFAGDGDTAHIYNNNTATNNTGVYMETAGSTLYLNSRNNGSVVFDDIVDGTDYNIQVGGDLSGMVRFNNSVNNLNTLVMADGGSLYVGENQTLNMLRYQAEDNGQTPQLLLNVIPDGANNTLTNGVLEVAGDVKGTTNVVVNSLNADTFADSATVLSPFVVAPADDTATSAAFNVSRVIGSPYMYETRYNARGDETGSVWYLGVKQKPDTPGGEGGNASAVYAPEITIYDGTVSTLIEQNRRIGARVARGLGVKSCCGIPTVSERLWVDASYETADIHAPSEIDADIYAVTAGLDLFRSRSYRLGIFGSYQGGKYDFSGDGRLWSDIGGKIDMTGWLGGLYYDYRYNNWQFLAMLFGGKQDLDVSTADHAVSAGADATQYGADITLSRTFMLSSAFDLEPSLGIFYTSIDMDDIRDNAGKTAAFEDMHYGEAELGLKLSYLFCRGGCSNRLYVKPSIIQTFGSGGKTVMTGIAGHSVYDDQTLGRVEIGGEFSFSRSFKSYLSAGHTFGDDYDAFDVNLGLNYLW